MERVFFKMKLKPGYEEQYDKNHAAVWPSVLEAIERSGVKAYSIFRDGLDLYAHVEAADFDRSMAALNAEPEHTRWAEKWAYMFEPAPNPTADREGAPVIPEVFRFEAK